MLFAVHAITAGVVGDEIGNPIIAFLAGITIHFVLDAIPHYDTTDEGKFTARQWALVLADFTVAILSIIFISPRLHHPSSFWFGIAGGVIVDFFDSNPWVENWFRLTKFGAAVHRFHDGIQHKKIAPLPGLALQYVILLIVLLVFFSANPLIRSGYYFS